LAAAGRDHRPHTADLILQLPARPLEGVVDGECQIGMPLVGLRGTVDIDFAAVGKRQTNVNLVETAGVVMAAGSFQRHPASGGAAILPFQLAHMRGDNGAGLRICIHALEIDLDRCLHGVTSIKPGWT
jgi:hypothetical protein